MTNYISDFVYGIHNVTLFVVINIILSAFSIICLVIIKRIIPNPAQREDLGSLGGFLSGAVGSVYAISTGFVLIYLLGNFNKAEDVVAAEAVVLMRVADTINWLPDTIKLNIFPELQNYIQDVTTHEWPLMQKGKKVDIRALVYLQNIIRQVKAYEATDPMQLFIKQKIFDQIHELRTVRYTRIKMSDFSLNIQYWFIIIIMTIISIIFGCMLGIKLYLHNCSVILASITSSCMLFLLVILDKPFRGMFAVNQADLLNALLYIQKVYNL